MEYSSNFFPSAFYRGAPATKQHSKKRPLSTIKLFKEVASSIPSCTNPRNPPHTVAITTTGKGKSEILFGLTHPLAKMLQQFSKKNFSLYCLNIFPPTTNTTRSSINKCQVKYSYVPNIRSIIAQHNTGAQSAFIDGH